jgi:hypothetical protein
MSPLWRIAKEYSPQLKKKHIPPPQKPLETRMPGYSDPGFDTLALHAGAAPTPPPARAPCRST